MADKALFRPDDDVGVSRTGAGLPAAVAQAMLGADGLPRGVQIIAASFAHILRPRRWPRLERGGKTYVKQFADCGKCFLQIILLER